jgi:hypothetical protein
MSRCPFCGVASIAKGLSQRDDYGVHWDPLSDSVEFDYRIPYTTATFTQ